MKKPGMKLDTIINGVLFGLALWTIILSGLFIAFGS